jgi:hypothetical protein
MTCGRCEGLMVVEPSSDTDLAIFGEPQEARCINCGNIEDAVICTNRLGPLSTGRARVSQHRHRYRTQLSEVG